MVRLYRAVSELWRQIATFQIRSEHALPEQRRIAKMSPLAREAFLLIAMEGLSEMEAAAITGATADEMIDLMKSGIDEAGREDAASVVIIEDEFLIAKEIELIVTELGHIAAGRARTRTAARALTISKDPDLIIADVHLADDSSGIDAAHDLLSRFGSIPVIFVTSFSDRLLSERRPAPASLVVKPFIRREMRSAITQNLFYSPRSGPDPLRADRSSPPLLIFP